MGCVQSRPSSLTNTPESHGVERLKAEHGYVGRRPSGAAAGEEEERAQPLAERKMDDDLVDGWPRWLVSNVPRGVLEGLVPKSADSYQMIGKVGQGTYSNVYKARDKDTGKLVALKKVRFDTSESESVRFMAREITILQKLDHPNVLKLEGLATSRMQYSLYLVFEYMQSDLARIISRPEGRLTEPQVKCYMHQLLSGLQHCHERGILHRDIKGSNLLIDRNGMLKIGDFGLANQFDPEKKQPLTSRVVTLWYRAPELILGATDYGVGIDLWSAGCLLAEMFAGRPIMPGRTEVEQLHRIFKLCGSPSEDYWRKLKLSTNFRPPQLYKPNILEAFRDFPASSLGLLTTLLALEPSSRGTVASALQNEFFTTRPLACELSGLPVIYQQENDDSTQPQEKRKRKNSKLKRRSQSQKENVMKLEEDMRMLKAGYHSSKEGEKIGELPGSSTASTSASITPQQPWPVAASFSKKSATTEYHPAATRNIVNPTPQSATTGYHPAAAKNIVNPSPHSDQSPGTECHPSAARNIVNMLPPRPSPKIPIADCSNETLDLMQYRTVFERRSASMSAVGRVFSKGLPEYYAPDD